MENVRTKKNRSFDLALLLFVFLFAQESVAQTPIMNGGDYRTRHLPDGAIARLGKGWIGGIAYSQDGTRYAVGSSLGIWLYDTQTDEELSLLTGHTYRVLSVSFSPIPIFLLNAYRCLQA